MKPNATEYIRELARSSKAYGLLLALEENPQADDSCFQSLAGIVDRIRLFEVSLDGGTLEGLLGLVTGTEELASTLAGLERALAEAEPDRGSVHVLLAGYPKWLKTISGVARPRFLETLPKIAMHLKELGASGVDTLIASFNTCASMEDCELLAGCVSAYRETSGSILIAAAEIASIAIQENSRSLIEKMTAAVSVEAMLDSKPSRELLPAIAKVTGKLNSAAAAGICLTVAGSDHSSALNLARQLEASAASMSLEMRAAYLKSFQRIVEEAGISLLGYGTKQLPGVFQKAGEARAVEFVEQGLAIAHRYGRLAAEEYFEQKTAAAKKASPLG